MSSVVDLDPFFSPPNLGPHYFIHNIDLDLYFYKSSGPDSHFLAGSRVIVSPFFVGSSSAAPKSIIYQQKRKNCP